MQLKKYQITTRGVFLLVLSLSLAFISFPYTTFADPLGNVTTYTANRGDSYYNNVTTGPDGNMWYSSRIDNKIFKVTTSGVVTAYPLPSGYSRIESLINGPNKSIWFSVYRSGVNTYSNAYAIARIDTSGNFTFYNLPVPQDKTTTTSEVTSITAANGKIWVARGYSKYIQILTPNSGNVTVKNYRISKPAEVSSDAYNSPSSLYSAEEVIYNPVDKSIYIITREREPGNSTIGYYIEVYSIGGNGTVHPFGYGSLGLQGVIDPILDGQGNVWFIGYFSGSSYKYKIGRYDVSVDSTQSFATSRANDKLMSLTLGLDGNVWATARDPNNSSYGRVVRADPATFGMTEFSWPSGNNPYHMSAGADNNLWVTSEAYNIRKFGLGGITNSDSDGDGLTSEKELIQGTSDFSNDTDNDGLSDYTESQWNTMRNDVFCHPITNYCEYPEPLQQDIYTEIDWMDRSGGGGFSTKPSATQIDLVKDAFASKGIKAHFDTGQLGGGEELSHEDSIYYLPETGERDLYDYRDGEESTSQSFATNRKDIYHYMISADNIAYNSSGVSNPAADESIVAYGYIKDNPSMYTSFDTAVSGTIIHELGHGLCLTNDTVTYYDQKPSCVFTGVDEGLPGTTLPNPFYVSSMNYSYQFELVDYSDGDNVEAHPTGDYDDWSALGLGDYTQVDILDLLGGQLRMATLQSGKPEAKQKLQVALNADQAVKLKQAREKAGIKIKKAENGKFEVTQTQNGRTKRLN